CYRLVTSPCYVSGCSCWVHCGASTSSCASRIFSFNRAATAEIYTLSLHDALPIFRPHVSADQLAFDRLHRQPAGRLARRVTAHRSEEHTSELQYVAISYAVFCFKKKIGLAAIVDASLPNTDHDRAAYHIIASGGCS